MTKCFLLRLQLLKLVSPRPQVFDEHDHRRARFVGKQKEVRAKTPSKALMQLIYCTPKGSVCECGLKLHSEVLNNAIIKVISFLLHAINAAGSKMFEFKQNGPIPES